MPNKATCEKLDKLAYEPKPDGRLPRLLSDLSAMCCDNAKVVEHTYAVGGGTGSNHAMLSLGAGDGAKATSLYQIKYTGKDSVNISHAGTLFIESKKRVEQFPSVAEDAKTDPVRCACCVHPRPVHATDDMLLKPEVFLHTMVACYPASLIDP